jgi:hypothetical protein
MTRLADELLMAALRGTPGMEIAERSFLSTGLDHLSMTVIPKGRTANSADANCPAAVPIFAGWRHVL